MIGVTLLAFGLVLIVEGLVYALAPWLVEDLLAALRQMSLETRRLAGFAAISVGVALVWLAAALGAFG